MKVKDLIRILQDMNPEFDVEIFDCETGVTLSVGDQADITFDPDEQKVYLEI